MWQKQELPSAVFIHLSAKKMNKYLKLISSFLTEVKAEVKKVTWPTKKETTGGTAVVLVAVFIAAIFLGLVDFSLSEIVKKLIKF